MTEVMTRPLSVIATDIIAEHTAAERAPWSALEHAKRTGELVLEAKAQLPHGQWLPWIAANCDISDRVAQNYMRISREWARIEEIKQKRKGFSYLGLVEVLRLLNNPDDDDNGDDGDADDEDEDDDDEDDDETDKYPQKLQLFYSVRDHAEIVAKLRALRPVFKTANTATTLLAAVRHLHAALVQQDSVSDELAQQVEVRPLC
jgi:hypothetical protein